MPIDSVTSRGLLGAAILLLMANTSLAQNRAEDRKRYLGPDQRVSDDPRRIPERDFPKGPQGITALLGGRVFDGTGSPPREGIVVLERNQIRAVLSADESPPPDARIIDVSGQTILPGLIDLHTHISYAESDSKPDEADAMLRAVERLRYYIESGITSIRDTASHGNVPYRAKEWVARNRLPGPRVFPVGQLITATGGHGAEGLDERGSMWGAIREASGPDDWREAVREQFKRGADCIKLASHYSKEEIRAAVDEAHALGLRVTVDAESFYIDWAVEAGADCIEHPLPRSDETIRLMAEKGTASVPTLIPYIYIFDLAGGYFGSTSRRFGFSKEGNLDVLRRMKEAGIKMGIGTDLVSNWFRFLPQPYIVELEQFVKVGYTRTGALVAATKTSAEILDMDDKLGTLEPGKLADVVVIDGRPDENLADLARVDLVFRDGYMVVEKGEVVIPRHIPRSPPRSRGG